jgi:hypothetical protein
MVSPRQGEYFDKKIGCHSEGGGETPTEESGKLTKRKGYVRDSSLPLVVKNDILIFQSLLSKNLGFTLEVNQTIRQSRIRNFQNTSPPDILITDSLITNYPIPHYLTP